MLCSIGSPHYSANEEYRSEGVPLRDILSLGTLGRGVGWLGVFRRRRRRRRRRRLALGGPKFDGKQTQEWVFLVGKTFPDPVGVFCGLLGLPSGHIGQKSDFSGILGSQN